MLLVAGRRVPVLTIAALAPAAVMLLTPALSGHASVSGKIAFVTDVAHVTAAAVWVGGFAALVLALLWAGRERWQLAADAVPRFSGLAVVAVSWLIASGTISGYLQVRALRGLWETTYGQLLLLKLSLVLPLLAARRSTTTGGRCRGCVSGSRRPASERGSCASRAPSSR